MSENIIELYPAINLSNISSHPAEAIAALIEVLKRQEQQIADLEERTMREIAMDRRRITALEQPDMPRKGKKTDARLRALENLLIARGNEPLTFSEVGKYLELGSRKGKSTTRRQNMTLLGKIAANDERFHVFESNTQQGAKMIALNRDYFARGLSKV
ncbi:MAG TPA: hypothetical protein PLQ01_09845 [Methanothrix sp.]|nr:hypothetical protein [Methanothrix sp.]